MPHDGSDLMERIRQIVNQQKLRCLDENKLNSSSIAGLNLDDLMGDNHDKTEVSSKFVTRKVAETTAPSPYPGFSTVSGDQKKISTNDTYFSTCKSDAKANILKRLHGTSPTNPCIRHVSAKSTRSQHVDSQINTIPNNVHAWRQGKELIDKYLGTSSESIDKHGNNEEQSPKLDHSSPLGFDAVIDKNNPKILNLNQNEPKNTVNTDKASKQMVNAPLVASKSGKGLFHSIKKKNEVNNHSDALESVQKDIHGCPTPRAHLKALVQQQREARKQEHKRQLEAEKEKREQIQRNLQATALAAAAAAKLPVTSTKKMSEHSPVIPVCLFQPVKAPVLTLNSYSSEREQKLDELLRREISTPENQIADIILPTSSDRDSIHSSYRDFIETLKVRCSSTNSHVANPIPTSESSMKRNRMTAVNKYEDIGISRPPKCGKLNNSCNHPIQTNNCKQMFNSNPPSMDLQKKCLNGKSSHMKNLQMETVALSPTKHKFCTVGSHTTCFYEFESPKRSLHEDTGFQVPVPFSENVSTRPRTSVDVTRRPETLQKRLSPTIEPIVPYANRPKTICDHVTEAARLDIKLSAQRVKHMLVIDSEDDDNDDNSDEDQCFYTDDGVNSSVSSYETIHKPTASVWRRLEAVGASESELEENNVCIVEDIKDEKPVIVDNVSQHCSTSWKYNANTNNFHQSGLNNFIGDIRAKNEFRNLIYSDPLRFASVHKRQQTLFHRRGKKPFKSLEPQVNSIGKVEVYEKDYTNRSSSLHSPREKIDKESLVVKSNAPGNTNIQAVNVECTDSGDRSSSSHTACSIRTKAQELFITDDKSDSQALPTNHQKINNFINKTINPSQLRLTPAALNLQLAVEMNYLETLSGSMQHIADMESLRQITAAQAECVSLAQLLKARELQISSKISDYALEKETPGVFVSPNEPGRLISGVHSPQFESVLKAAEEFDKVERRLSVRTSHLDAISYCSTESPSVDSNITNEANVHKSLNGSISESSVNKQQFSTGSDKTLSNDNNVIKSISGGVVTASDSSDEPCRPIPTSSTVASMTTIDKVSEPGKLTVISSSLSPKLNNFINIEKKLEKKKKISVDFSGDDDESMKLYGKVTNEEHQRKSNDQVLIKRKKLKRHSRNEKSHIKSTDIPMLNLCVAMSPNSSCQTERNEKFNQVKYALNKRVAALQSRRKKAEELLALSKNIELEEVEVVRLEREALNAIQSKRLALHENRSQLSNDNESKKYSTSSHWSKNSNSKHWRSNSHSPVCQRSSYSQYSDELGLEEPGDDKTNSERIPTASLGKSSSLLKCNIINSNTASECSTARTMSTATDLKYCKSDSDSNRSAAHSEKHHSNTSFGNNYKLIPNRYNERCTPNLLSTENDDYNSRVSKVSNYCLPKLDIGVETTPSLRNLLTCEVATPSLDRTVTPTSRHLRQRSNSHDSGRRRRVTVLNSVDSMDEDGRLFGVGDDEPFSTVSANSHSDLSELESRIQALNSNLQKQESILCRINVEYKRVHKDRLARLESTLLKHRQLCTEIIANIKADLDICRASVCTEANDSHSKPMKKVIDTDNISYTSPSKSLNKTTLDNFNDNSISCASSKRIDKLALSTHILTSKHSTNNDDTEPDTLISVAEELVSSQDTDDELKQLDLDDDIDRSTPVAEHSPNSTNKNNTYLCNADVSAVESKQTTNSEMSKNKRSLSPSIHTESSYYTDFQPSSEDNNSKSLNNQDILPKEIEKESNNTSMKSIINSTEKMLIGEVTQTNNVFSNQSDPKNFINECSTVLGVTVADNEFESNDILSKSPFTTVPEANYVSDGKISTVTTEDFNNMVVSTDISVPSAKTSLHKVAADHRQREELVDQITTELLNQLVSEAIDSTLNVRKSNFQIESPENSESDDEDDLLDDEFHQRSSESQSSSEESVPLLDLGLKAHKDYEEKCPETDKSKICVTPEPSYTVDNIEGLFADTPDRTQPLIHLAVKHFWDAKLNAKSECEEVVLLKASNNPPLEFSVDYYDEADLELFKTQSNVKFINRALLFDLISEIIQKIYVGEDNDVELQERLVNSTNSSESKTSHRVSSAQFRLWRGPCPPTTYNRLLTIVTSEVCRELNLKIESKSEMPNHNGNKTKYPGLNEVVPSGVRLSRLVQWTLAKKSWLDRVLDLELRADEPSWLSYVPEEREIKMKLARELWEDILDEALNSVLASNACHLSK
ncbi:unnamed protein product [Schistosoma rodhaini]|nr:unnamed protein product [Schistosoma rodhaini]